MLIRILCLVWITVAALSPAIARADEPETGDTPEEVRSSFEAGLVAADEGRWDDARQHFERAYAGLAEPAILFNLAGAQSQCGRLSEALASYNRFLASPGSASAEIVDLAQQRASELEGRVPRLDLRIAGLETDDEVRIGRNVQASLDHPLRLDPGAHEIVVAREQQTVLSHEITLEESERRRLELVISVEEPSRPSPWVWVGVGLGTATAVVLTAVLAAKLPRQPYNDNLR